MRTNHADVPIFQLLIQAARALEAVVHEAPPALTGTLLNSEMVAGVDEVVTVDRSKRDLPSRVSAILFNGVPVLLGELEPPPDRATVGDALRRFRNQATIARSWLGMDAQNLQLFLIGPPGSAGSDEWMDLAESIQADDRVCRKLVWLPEPDPTPASAQLFLGRTFLARPWAGLGKQAVPRLDQLSSIVLPPGWREVLEDDELEPDALVARIVEAHE
jgi:hypothetical protein